MDRPSNSGSVRGVYGAERAYGFSVAGGHGAADLGGGAAEHGLVCASLRLIPVRNDTQEGKRRLQLQ